MQEVWEEGRQVRESGGQVVEMPEVFPGVRMRGEMKTVYVMQVKVFEDGKSVWKDVRPSRGRRYEYDTRDEAERMLPLCSQYSDSVRVVPVEV